MAGSAAIRGGRRRGALAALAALLLGTLAAAAPPSAAQPGAAADEPSGAPRAGARGADRPRALIAFLPVRPRPSERLLDELAERGLATGLTSPTVGGYSPGQMVLDMSQGARLTGAAYPGLLDWFDLRVTDGGGRIEGWPGIRARARAAPGTVIPGLLAGTIDDAGGLVSYAGVGSEDGRDPRGLWFRNPLRRAVRPAEREEEAIASADRAGRIGRVSLGSAETLAARTVELWRAADLVVARLPRGGRGLAALDRVLVRAGPEDLVYVVQAPPPAMELLPTGARGTGLEGILTSDTTRRAGLVVAPDVAPTVLSHLGIPVPAAMQGEPLRAVPGEVEDLRGLDDRLSVIVPRREPALAWTLGTWGVLVALLALARGEEGARAALRIGFLAALWMPGLALLTAALRPSEAVEVTVLTAGGLGLAAVGDRLLPWPAGPAVPAVAVVVAHAADLAAGSPLIATSLAGPNPLGGARFFGVGNELEAALSLTVLLGAGAAAAVHGGRHAGAAPRMFALACLVAAVIVGAGQLGAAVGGVVTLAAGGAAAVLASLRARPSRRAVALAVAAPLVGLACLAAIDIATAGGAHFTREVLQGDDPADLIDTMERRLDLSASGLEHRERALAVVAAAVLLVVGVVRRRTVLAPLDRAGPGPARAFRAGLIGGLVATIVGALVNDSGPTIFLIGAVMLALAVAYVNGRPPARAAASTTLSRCA